MLGRHADMRGDQLMNELNLKLYEDMLEALVELHRITDDVRQMRREIARLRRR
jgi:hypothetical protein